MINDTKHKVMAKEAERLLDLMDAGTWKPEEIKALLTDIKTLYESADKPRQRRNLKAARVAQFSEKGWSKPLI